MNKLLIISVLLIVAAYGSTVINDAKAKTIKEKYNRITFEKMYDMIDEVEDYLILDVRTMEEYVEGRIPNSTLIPDKEISKIVENYSDKDINIFVYCRSGNRSKKTTLKLINMGYEKVFDVGGIIDYPYELVF